MRRLTAARSERRGRAVVREVAAVILVGLAAGIGAVLVTVVLATVEHAAYGYRSGTFLDGVVRAAPGVRVLALTIAGVVGGIGWWALRRWGRPSVSVERAVEGTRMPAVTTISNVGLQLVIVGLGASIGREVAPRQLGALAADWIAGLLALPRVRRSTLIACGAGAGLAAVYNVPLGGALFTLEVLLADWSLASVIPALATAGIATLLARVVVPATAFYTLPPATVTASLVVWALLAGPVVGAIAVSFTAVTTRLRARRPTGWRLLVVMPTVFLAVGLLGAVLPQLLGNGRALGQVAFTGTAPLALIGALAVGKYVATAATIGSGAEGGTLTPSVAIGAALGTALAGAWSLAWPGASLVSGAVIAASAFLATTMEAPLTGTVLVLEFTNADPALLVPVLLAVSGATATRALLNRPHPA